MINYPSYDENVNPLSPTKSQESQIRDITNINIDHLDEPSEQTKLDYSVSDITDDL